VTQQEFFQSVAMAKLILLCRFARPHQIAQRLVFGIWNPYCC
jgi:hypothetical protein